MGQQKHKYISTELKIFASLPSSYLPEVRRQSMGRLFGSCIQESRKTVGLSLEKAALLSSMKASEWMAVEEGSVPQDVNQLRAMVDARMEAFTEQ